MLLVNFLGGFKLCPRILKHTHDYCSYADTIMPQFLFAAGFALQLSWGRMAQADRSTRWTRVARRFVGLTLVAVIWYTISDWGGIRTRLLESGWLSTLGMVTKRTWFQTLLHIAVTSLWISPVIGRSTGVRCGWAVGSGLSHVVLSWAFNFHWVNTGWNGIDGGPLGFLTWTIPALVGTMACDVVRSGATGQIPRLFLGGAGLAFLGYLMSLGTLLYNVPVMEPVGAELPAWFGPVGEKLAIDPVVPTLERMQCLTMDWPEPPFVPPPESAHRQWNYWMMSQRAGTLSYCVFSSGISLIVFAVCVGFSDRCGWQLGVLRTFGTNALAAYILHDIAGWIIAPWITSESSVIRTLLAFMAFFVMTYGACRVLEWKKWYLRM